MTNEDEEYIIRNIMVTMGVEGKKLQDENVELIRRYLRKEITMEEALKTIDNIVLKRM